MRDHNTKPWKAGYDTHKDKFRHRDRLCGKKPNASHNEISARRVYAAEPRLVSGLPTTAVGSGTSTELQENR